MLCGTFTDWALAVGAPTMVIDVVFVPLSSVTLGLVVPKDELEEKVVLAVPLAIATDGGVDTLPSVPGAKVRFRPSSAVPVTATVFAEVETIFAVRVVEELVAIDEAVGESDRASRVVTVVVPAGRHDRVRPRRTGEGVGTPPVVVGGDGSRRRCRSRCRTVAVSLKNRLSAMLMVPPPARDGAPRCRWSHRRSCC